uniref:Phospholipase B-like lamina ancestor n=1 Tax=Cacopsylla melanoneura TaxID=428564 RepID=A0A8D8M7Y8_9HEMI
MLKVVGASWVQTRVSWLLLIGISLLGLVALYYGPSYSAEPDGKYAATVYYGQETKFRLEYWGQNNNPADIKKGVARGFYQPDIYRTGWATLEIETQDTYSDGVQACAAGMLEGALSWQMIQHHWLNTIHKTCAGRQEYCARARNYLSENAEQVRKSALRFDSIDPFWHQVNLFYVQLDGLEIGWRSGIRRSRRDFIDIPKIDFLWMNVMPDLRDLERKFNGTADFNPYRPPLSFALLKYFPDNPSKYILTHASAGTYNSMLRIQKRYNFAYHDSGDEDSDLVNGRIITFSSYPGTIFSGDDYYQVKSSSGEMLTVVGTELKNHNQSTWEFSEADHPVLMGPRVMAANRLSRGGDDWSSLFTRRNSGTGNKQWLVVDTGDNFTVWAVEQMPGLTHAQEVTQRIVDDGYWIACGIPYFQDILMQSEDSSSSDTSSLYRLKNVNPLYNTLKKYATNITTVDSVVQMVRSYDISLIGRSDLNGNSNLYGFLNVTHSINRHHKGLQHSRQVGEDMEIHAESSFGREISKGNKEITSENMGVVPRFGGYIRDSKGISHGGLISSSKASFHNANFYEHKNDPRVLSYGRNGLVVEMRKDKLGGIAVKDGENANQLKEELKDEDKTLKDHVIEERLRPYDTIEKRHKYAAVHAQTKDDTVENKPNLIQSTKGEINRSEGSLNEGREYKVSDESGNTVIVKTREDNLTNNSSSEDSDNNQSSSTNSEDSISVRHISDGSQNSNNSNSNSRRSETNSDSSSQNDSSLQNKHPSSSRSNSMESNYYESKSMDNMLRVHVDSDSVDTNNAASEVNRFNEKAPQQPADISVKRVQIPATQRTTKISQPNSHQEPASKLSNQEFAPKIDIQFKTGKDLLHSKLDAKKLSSNFGAGLGFVNMTKQFRGIIDVKISHGDEDFVAIAGPPYYRNKAHESLNNSRNSTVNSSSVNNFASSSTTKPETSTQKPSISPSAVPEQPIHVGSPSSNVEPFQWSKSYIKYQKHVGHPDLWDFGMFKATWVWS